MDFLETEIDQGVVVGVSGRLDTVGAIDFQKKLLSLLLKPNLRYLIIDLKNVDYLGSTSMRAILIAAKRAKELSVFVCLVNLAPSVSEVLEISGFNSFLKVYDTLDIALAQLPH